MDTAIFFSKILPREGLKVLAEYVGWVDKKTGANRHKWEHTTYTSFSQMAEAVAQFEEAGKTVYHANGGFGDFYFDETEQRQRIRTQKNVVACRSLYDDIDVGKTDTDCYATIPEANAAIRAYVKEVGLPAPLVVYSGSGIHLYWALTEDITTQEWLELAVLKRRIARHLKLKFDPACDLDYARVLRPVGSFNKKRGDRVEVVSKNDPAPTSADTIRKILEAYVTTHHVPLLRHGTPSVKNAFAAALAVDYPDSFADNVAASCKVIQWFKETGAPNEPVWHKCIGALKHCVDGEQKIHEWSSNFEGYNEGETQSKIDSWKYGPTTCDAFRSIAQAQCEGCTLTCKTPVQIGYKEESTAPDITRESLPEPEPSAAIATASDGTPVLHFSKALTDAELIKAIWPQGFVAGGDTNGDGKYKYLTKTQINPETGIVEHIRFCDTVFYPVWLQAKENEEDGVALIIEYITHHGKKRRFSIPADSVASPDKLAVALAAHVIWINEGRAMSNIAREFVRKAALGLQIYKREVEIHKAFGWTDDGRGFVIGKTMITADGEEPVVLGKRAESGGMAIDYGVSGSRDKWVSLVNTIYNRTGAEAYQFAFLIAAASPLVSLVGVDGYHGIPIAYTGDTSLGKTATCRMACSIWGQGELFNRNTNDGGSTSNAMLGRMSVVRHLPWIFDELTGRSIEDLKIMFFALSNGQGKDRMTAVGTFAGGDMRWDTTTFVTGNMDITGFLATLDKMVADALQVRVFEVKLPADYTDRVFKGIDVKNLVDGELQNQYGHVGRELIRRYMSHRAKIVARFMELRKQFNPRNVEETRERYYIDTVCLALVAGEVMCELGLIQFDLEAIQKWAFATIKSLRQERVERTYSDDELVGQFLNSLQGRVIVTKRLPDARKKESPEQPLEQIRGEPLARHAVLDRRFIVAAKALAEWGKEHGLAPEQMRKSLEKANYFAAVVGRPQLAFVTRLGQGTLLATGSSRCYELNYDKVFGGVNGAPVEADIIPIKKQEG